jgi:hypothetical protein
MTNETKTLDGNTVADEEFTHKDTGSPLGYTDPNYDSKFTNGFGATTNQRFNSGLSNPIKEAMEEHEISQKRLNYMASNS